jgi:predicted SnoaL-like aldol condensation-catalyzing enzyme
MTKTRSTNIYKFISPTTPNMIKFTSILLFFIATACTNGQDQQAKNKEVVRKVFEELINENKPANIDMYYVPNMVDHSAWPGQIPGREGLKQSIIDFHNNFSSLNANVDEILSTGNKVITRESWTGINNKNNKPASGTVMHIF